MSSGGDILDVHPVNAAAPAMLALLRRVAGGQLTAEDARDVLLDWPPLPPTDPDLLGLHRVAVQARDAVEVAASLGVHLGPLRAALDATAYRVPSAGGAR